VPCYALISEDMKTVAEAWKSAADVSTIVRQPDAVVASLPGLCVHSPIANASHVHHRNTDVISETFCGRFDVGCVVFAVLNKSDVRYLLSRR
jgi:hypothetical protein